MVVYLQFIEIESSKTEDIECKEQNFETPPPPNFEDCKCLN